MSKIVCTGWSKTGSGSVGQMFRILGYETTQRPFKGNASQDPAPLDGHFIGSVMLLLRTHEAFHDMPWTYLFPLVDQHYPDSKYIHTYRESSDKWLASAKAYYQSENASNRFLYQGYGLPDSPEAEKVWKARYRLHELFVRAYFADRKDDILYINIDKGELTWEAVCGFLGVPVPDEPVPHLNPRGTKGSN